MTQCKESYALAVVVFQIRPRDLKSYCSKCTDCLHSVMVVHAEIHREIRTMLGKPLPRGLFWILFFVHFHRLIDTSNTDLCFVDESEVSQLTSGKDFKRQKLMYCNPGPSEVEDNTLENSSEVQAIVTEEQYIPVN